MDRLVLDANERSIFGKKVKKLRMSGTLPAHVFGKGIDTEHVSVGTKTFLKTYAEAGETGLIDLKIGQEKVKPVLIRDVQHDPLSGVPIHVDFYQVNLTQKVKVPIPLELSGDEPEKVHLGEAIVLQTLNEVEVEALPGDLVEKIEVDISTLSEIDDAITLADLNYDREKLTILADAEEVVVKLAPAVSAQMEELLEEQAAETAEAAAQATEGEEGAEVVQGESAPTEARVDKEGEVEEDHMEEGSTSEGQEKPKEGG